MADVVAGLLDLASRFVGELIAAGATAMALKGPALVRGIRRRLLPDDHAHPSIVVAIRRADLRAIDSASGEARVFLEWINLGRRQAEISSVGIAYWYLNESALPQPAVEVAPVLLALPASSMDTMNLVSRLFEPDLSIIYRAARVAPNPQSTAANRLTVTVRFVVKARWMRKVEVKRTIEAGGVEIAVQKPAALLTS